MRAFFTTIGIFILLASTAVAQSQSSGFDPSKLVYSGTFNFSFTNNFSAVTISPQVGYAFNKFFTAGTGINYNYRNQGNTNTSLNFLGLNVYGRVMPIQYVALQVQPEAHYMWGKALGNDKSKMIPCMLVGAGVIVPTGKVGAINAMIYYDVVQYTVNGVNYSPYGNKVIYSVGYIFSF